MSYLLVPLQFAWPQILHKIPQKKILHNCLKNYSKPRAKKKREIIRLIQFQRSMNRRKTEDLFLLLWVIVWFCLFGLFFVYLFSSPADFIICQKTTQVLTAFSCNYCGHNNKIFLSLKCSTNLGLMGLRKLNVFKIRSKYKFPPCVSTNCPVLQLNNWCQTVVQ